jgi:hypothetical protein
MRFSTADLGVRTYKTHLSTDRSTNINKLHMGKFLLDTLNLWVGDCPSNEPLEGSNGVTEVGGL